MLEIKSLCILNKWLRATRRLTILRLQELSKSLNERHVPTASLIGSVVHVSKIHLSSTKVGKKEFNLGCRVDKIMKLRALIFLPFP
jgi:hypothetical protein